MSVNTETVSFEVYQYLCNAPLMCGVMYIFMLICFIDFCCWATTKVKYKKKKATTDEKPADIAEIERLRKFLSKGDSTVFFVHGGFGIGKTTKTKNALNNMNEKYFIFDAYSTGFSENFILILYKKLLANTDFSLYKKLYAISNAVLKKENMYLIYVTFALSGITSLLFKGTGKGDIYSLMYFLIPLLIVNFYMLPELLTFKKDYSIFGRDFYNSIILCLMPNFTVIDDFDRLSHEQQQSIYEFLNFFRNQNTTKKVIIIGNRYNLSCDEMANSIEDIYTKFIDETFEMETLNDVVIDFLSSDSYLSEKFDITDTDREIVDKLVKSFDHLLTRRLFEDVFLKYSETYLDENIVSVFIRWLNQQIPVNSENYQLITQWRNSHSNYLESVGQILNSDEKPEAIRLQDEEFKKQSDDIAEIINSKEQKFSEHDNINVLLCLKHKRYTKRKIETSTFKELQWRSTEVRIKTINEMQEELKEYISDEVVNKFKNKEKIKEDYDTNGAVLVIHKLFNITEEFIFILCKLDQEKDIIMYILTEYVRSISSQKQDVKKMVNGIANEIIQDEINLDEVIEKFFDDYRWVQFSTGINGAIHRRQGEWPIKRGNDDEIGNVRNFINYYFSEDAISAYRNIMELPYEEVVEDVLTLWQIDDGIS